MADKMDKLDKPDETIDIMANFVTIKHSPYMVGVVEMMDPVVDAQKIYQHGESGEIRMCSDDDLDGCKVAMNGADAVTMKKRGRFGRLYVGRKGSVSV